MTGVQTCALPIYAATYQTASNIGGGTYPTYFFINSPYNPGAGNTNPQKAVSTTQFCRQCHWDTANEYFGINNVTTQY